MNEKHPASVENKHGSQGWLEHLRNNSWEMELLLTGFVLVGLFHLPEILSVWKSRIAFQVTSQFIRNVIGMSWRMLDTSVDVIIINLILLLLMRGYWIGLIGLDSTIHRRSRNVVHDDLAARIRKLDDACSIIFALTFLIVFVTISSSLFMIWVILMNSIVGIKLPSIYIIPYRTVVLTLDFFIILIGLLNLINFLSLGWVSGIRKKWFAKPFSFCSRIVSYATLGFLSRLIYWKLLKAMPRKTFKMVLLFYVLVIIIVFAGIRYDKRFFFPTWESRFVVNRIEYENKADAESSGEADRIDDFQKRMTPTIQSDLITDSYIRLFIPYLIRDNDPIKESIPDIKPFKSIIRSEHINFGKNRDEDNDHRRILDFYNEYYRIAFDDSIQCQSDFLFYRPSGEYESGLLTYIPIGDLPNGLHELVIRRTNSDYWRVIPFWLMRENRK